MNFRCLEIEPRPIPGCQTAVLVSAPSRVDRDDPECRRPPGPTRKVTSMRLLATLVLTVAATAGIASAQEVPGRVGRIAHIEGTASVYQDPDTGWEKAYVNSPVTSENSVWTDASAHAEVRVSGVALRLDQLTQLDV